MTSVGMSDLIKEEGLGRRINDDHPAVTSLGRWWYQGHSDSLVVEVVVLEVYVQLFTVLLDVKLFFRRYQALSKSFSWSFYLCRHHGQ
jgi:hypothetical protein